MKMTKTVKAILLAGMTAGTCSILAAKESTNGIGLKGVFSTGIGSIRTGTYAQTYTATDDILNMGGGFALDAHFAFGPDNMIFIQPEAGMLFNNGTGNGFTFTYTDATVGITSSSSCAVSVTTIELPVLIGYQTKLGSVLFNAYMGPYVSIPVAGTVRTASGTENLSFGEVGFGATAGVGGSYKAGSGAFFTDIRYLFDLAATRMRIESTGDSVSVYARRAVTASAGYRLNL